MNDLLQLNVDAITMNDLIHNMKSSSSPTSSSRANSSPPTLDGSEVDDEEEDHEGSLMMGDDEALSFEVSPAVDLDLTSTLRPDDDDFGRIVVVVPQEKNTTVTDFIAEKEVEATIAQKDSASERLSGASDDTATPFTEKFVGILAVEVTTTWREEKEVLCNDATTASITSSEDVVRMQSNETKIHASAYPDNTDNTDTEQEKHSAEKFFDMSSRGRAHWHAVVDRKDSVSNLNDGTKPSYAEPETKDVSDRVPESNLACGDIQRRYDGHSRETNSACCCIVSFLIPLFEHSSSLGASCKRWGVHSCEVLVLVVLIPFLFFFLCIHGSGLHVFGSAHVVHGSNGDEFSS